MFVIGLALALGLIRSLTCSCPIIKVILIIRAFGWYEEAIPFCLEDYIYKLNVKVVRIGLRIYTTTC